MIHEHTRNSTKQDHQSHGRGFVEPLQTFTNEKGELEGVHYAQITTVLVNSIKEQQAQIEAQQEQLKQQQQQIDVLKQLVSRRRANRRGHKNATR